MKLNQPLLIALVFSALLATSLCATKCGESLLIGTNNTAFVSLKEGKGYDFALSDLTNNVLLRSEQKGTKVLAGHSDVVNLITQLGSSELLATSSLDYSVRVWNITSGHFITNFMWHSTDVKAMGYIDSYDKMITSATKDTIIWDYRTGNIMRKVDLPNGSEVLGILTVPGTQYIILSSSTNEIFLYDIPKFSFSKISMTNTKQGNPTLVHIIDQIFAVASDQSNTIDFYDYKKLGNALTSIEIPSFEGVKQGGLVFVKQDNTLYALGVNGHIRAYRLSLATNTWNDRYTAFYQVPPNKHFLGQIGYDEKNFALLALLENGVKKFDMKTAAAFSYEGECYRECPAKTFVRDGSCGICDASCESCKDSSPKSCLSCPSPSLLFYGFCLSACPDNSNLRAGTRTCECSTEYVLSASGICELKPLPQPEPTLIPPVQTTTQTTTTPSQTTTATSPSQTATATTPSQTATATTPSQTSTATTPSQTTTAATPSQTTTATTPSQTTTTSEPKVLPSQNQGPSETTTATTQPSNPTQTTTSPAGHFPSSTTTTTSTSTTPTTQSGTSPIGHPSPSTATSSSTTTHKPATGSTHNPASGSSHTTVTPTTKPHTHPHSSTGTHHSNAGASASSSGTKSLTDKSYESSMEYDSETVESPNLVAILVPIFSILLVVILGGIGIYLYRRRKMMKDTEIDSEAYDNFNEEPKASFEKASVLEAKKKVNTNSIANNNLNNVSNLNNINNLNNTGPLNMSIQIGRNDNSILFPQHKIGKPLSPSDFGGSGMFNSNHPQMVRLGTGNPY